MGVRLNQFVGVELYNSTYCWILSSRKKTQSKSTSNIIYPSISVNVNHVTCLGCVVSYAILIKHGLFTLFCFVISCFRLLNEFCAIRLSLTAKKMLRKGHFLLLYFFVAGLLVNGCINVVITTIEKRYGLRSSQTGLVASGYDIASFVCLVPTTYFGGRKNASKPKWIGLGK